MGYSSEIVASRYLYGSDSGLAWRDFPLQAWASTWSVDVYDAHAAAAGAPSYDESSFDSSLGYDAARLGAAPWPASGTADDLAYLCAQATDSAAAATAIATGRKTLSGCIAWSREGLSLETLPETMRSCLGSRCGVVSSVPFDHATPAAFVAHCASRGSYAQIAMQMTSPPSPDLIVGGGHPSYCASYFSAAALDELKASGSWSIAERAFGVDGSSSLAAAATWALPLFGLFGGEDGAFATPLPVSAPGKPALQRGIEDPSLASAAVTAARKLAGAKGGFFLMVEQGDIDWANHQNDLVRMIGAVASLDESVRAIEAWVDESGDCVDWTNTLLIVTADHATGLPRFSDSSSMAKGELPTRTTSSIPQSYAYSSGATLSYSTGGHGNELVTVAARGDRALSCFWAAAHLEANRIDDCAIYAACRAFAGL
jgi:Alkaline phosphatase